MEELICSSTVVLLSYLNSGICTLIRKKTKPKTLKMGRKEGRNYRSSDYNMYNVRRRYKKKI